MFVIKYRNIFFGLIGAITTASLVALAIFGLKISTDFTGGSLIEVRYNGAVPEQSVLVERLTSAGLEGVTVRGAGDTGVIIRAASLSESARAQLSTAVSVEGSEAKIERLTDIGPIIGEELRNKAFVATGLVILCIVLFIAFAFRKVSKPVSSWTYGLITVVTLAHDVIVPVGAFALFGYL
jgi:preprotein translocase subunit SecF